MNKNLNILVVDDDKKLLRVLTSVLEIQGHTVTAVDSGNAALQELTSSRFDVVLADLRMPRMDGLQLLKTLSLSQPVPKVVLMTAYATTETETSAKEFGAVEYLEKPFKLSALKQVLEQTASSTG